LEAIDWPFLTLCLVGSVLVGLLIFHAVAGYYHQRYYVRRKDEGGQWKCQPERWLRPEQQKEAALLSTFNLTLGGLNSGVLIYAIVHGLPTQLYYEVSEFGWLYTLLSVPVYFFLIDGGAYYVHKLLHIKVLFKHIHRHHHRYIATSPYVTVAVHPLELIALQMSTMLPLFLMPLHPAVIGGVLIYVLIFNIIDHSGVRLYSMWPWQASSLYHDDHHKYFHCNFGQHLMVFDKMHGTLRREKRAYGIENFGGRGKTEGGEAVLPDFIKY